MTIKPFDFKLKDGRTATILSPREEDINGVIEYLKISAGETEFILRYPEECDKYTYEAEKALFERKNASEDEAMLICIIDGKVAGNCSVSGVGNKRKIRHRCSMAIALYQEFWGLGIGGAMIGYLTELAEQIGYEQMDLEAVAENTRALTLYAKCGFLESGRRHHALKFDDGTLHDEILMYKPLRSSKV